MRSNLLTKLLKLLLIVSILYVYTGNIGSFTTSINQAEENGTIGEIVNGKEVKQYFTAQHNNISGISLKLATYMRSNIGDVTIGIKNAKNNKLIYSTKVKAESIQDNQYFDVRFPPIKFSKGKQYYIFVQSNGTPGKSITAYSYSNSSVGKLIVGKQKREGDLVFKISYNKTFFNYIL